MKKLLLYFSLITFFITTVPSAYSQTQQNNKSSGTIKGNVIDVKTNENLVGVNIYLQNTKLGAATDEYGNFEITSIPVGTQTIVASMIGYKPERVQISVEAGSIIEIDFELRTSLLEVGTIVVTGTATPYLYEESPVKTEVIPRKLIEQTKAINLAEALAFQTGVRVENDCQNCNFTQVRINGYDGKYSQILIDGDPVVNSLAGVYALEQFSQAKIGQIEVVKGGGSALYGSGSIAGSINIISQKPQFNSGNIGYQGQAFSETVDHQIFGTGQFVSDDGLMGGLIYGSVRNRNPYDRNGDGFSELGKLENESIGLNSFYHPFNDGELRLNLERIHEERRGGNRFDREPHEAEITEWLDHIRWGGKLNWKHNLSQLFNYSINYSFGLLDRDSYYGGLTDDDGDGIISEEERLAALDYYGESKSRTHIGGIKTDLTIPYNKITAGFEYFVDNLNDKTTKDIRYHIDNTYTNTGFYLQDDISLFDSHLNLILGARADKHSEVENLIFSPRANLKYEVLEPLTIRVSYTTGFRAPQTFDEDLHIESLGGDQRVVRNAPGLKEESSNAVSASLEFEDFVGDVALLFGCSGFYSKLSDAFSEVLIGEENGTILWNRINSDGAEVYGAEFDFGIKPISQIEIRSGLTIQTSKYDSPQEIFDGVFSEKFMRTPDTYGYLRTSYDPVKELNIFGSVIYTGSMIVPNERTEEVNKTNQSFWEIDLGISYRPELLNALGGKLTLGVKNLLDSYQDDLEIGGDRDPAYVYGPQLPRRVYFALETEL